MPAFGDPQFPNVFDLSSRVSWLATATARIGYAIQPQLLVYAKGGAAWMRSDLKYAITGMGVTDTYSAAETRTGWTVGAGLEYLIAANWSVFAEYSHMDFGSGTLNTTFILDPSPEPIRISHRVDTVMLGLNYRIGSPGALTGRDRFPASTPCRSSQGRISVSVIRRWRPPNWWITPEPVIGPRFARTRWAESALRVLNTGPLHELQCGISRLPTPYRA